MGYTTDFSGCFDLDRPLEPQHKAYLEAFASTRRMRRNATLTETYVDPVRLTAGLPIGTEGEYFVGSNSNFGQAETPDILDYNVAPADQPGLWCQWVPTDDGTAIEWDGGEKFYFYTEWLVYIIKHFLEPWGYALNGEVAWFGEERDDLGLIVVTNNQMTVKYGKVTYN